MKYDVIRSYWPAPIYSDGSTLDLDFTTGVLDSRLTFTRASTATYINSSGYVTTMGAAPTNDPTKARFDYDPVTLAPRGLLIEGSAVNLALNSSTMSSSTYTVQESTLGTGSSTDPSNAASAPKLSPSVGFSYTPHLIYSTVGVSNSTAYTLSVYAKANGYNRIGVCIAAGNRYTAVFNLTGSGTFVQASTAGTPAGTSYAITQVGTDGWYRCSVTMTTADTTLYPHIMVVNDGTITFNANAQATFVGDTSKSIYIWGAQLELGSGASSYISTGASQVTRNPDVCYLTDFAGWSAGGNFNTAEGTLFVDQAVTFVGTANYPLGGFSTSNTVGSRFGWQYRQGDSPQTYRGLVNAGYIYELPGGAGWSIPSGTTRFRHAMSCGGNTFLRQSFKSSASSGSPTQNNYSDVSTLNISGVAAFTLTPSAFASSVRIARVKYYPRAFTLAQLDELTN